MNKSGAGWPMANYIEAWKAFRCQGNEPEATASHILAQPLWPKHGDLRILDIGCGDGHMLEAFLLKLGSMISKVYLLDPEEWILSEAVKQIEGILPNFKIFTQVGTADEEGLDFTRHVDVGLAIHIVYLMSHSRFRRLINHWHSRIPLFVVLDAPDSVFSQLWNMTAQDYAVRSAKVHNYFENEKNSQLTIQRTDFFTHVTNPFTLSSPRKELVLSLLCYCRYEDLSEDVKKKVYRVITDHSEAEIIKCNCSCYEMIRR